MTVFQELAELFKEIRYEGGQTDRDLVGLSTQLNVVSRETMGEAYSTYLSTGCDTSIRPGTMNIWLKLMKLGLDCSEETCLR